MNSIRNLRISNPDNLLKMCGVSGVIPDMIKLSSIFDISVFDGDIRDSLVQYSKGIIGIYDSMRVIVINRNTTYTTRRFMIAYLFADYQLNSIPARDYFNIVYDESIYDKRVYCYALNLLMPGYLFDNDIYMNNYEDIQKLANKYGVSEYLICEREKLRLKQKKLKDKRKNFRVI